MQMKIECQNFWKIISIMLESHLAILAANLMALALHEKVRVLKVAL